MTGRPGDKGGMDRLDAALAAETHRRRLLIGLAGAVAVPVVAGTVDLRLPGGNGARPTTDAFPGKRGMILQRERPPLLETPMAVFNRDVFTPNDRFFVRWHWADIPTSVDASAFRLNVGGHVNEPLTLSLADILRLPRLQYAAVNQCSGNSRGLFEPRVPGAQWGHGAMGNARWTGVALRHILDLAGVKAGAVQVRFAGLDCAAIPDAPSFEKALDLDHARDGEVMVAFAMNGEQLPLLNGFPLRLVVPGFFSTYWMKALDRIEVLDAADPGYWMQKAYRIPTTSDGGVKPGAKDFPTAPIGRMIPRSWLTSLFEEQRVAFAPEIPVGGIAMGGDRGVARVDVSADGGRNWVRATLGPDHGRYSFRRWDARVPIRRGENPIMVRCWNSAGVAQGFTPVWNPGGYLRGNVETVRVIAA